MRDTVPGGHPSRRWPATAAAPHATRTPLERAVRVTTLPFVVSAATLFTAPAALHRSLFQRGAGERIVRVSSRLATAGTEVPGLAFTGSVPPVRRPCWPAPARGRCSPPGPADPRER
ncbi:DUF6328 family protein [Streptomyces sp. NPDC093586]|uniref:DUF6328 family protein n=1 Tax=Streptomyces sp. NPDC093586 TaxID=3366042 RepID=UPI0037FEB4D3